MLAPLIDSSAFESHVFLSDVGGVTTALSLYNYVVLCVNSIHEEENLKRAKGAKSVKALL